MANGAGDNLEAVVNYAELLDELKKKELVVGLPAGSADATVIEYAAHHEYGAPEAGIPKRSFLREPFEQDKKWIIKSIDDLVKIEAHLESGHVFEKAGEVAKAIVIKAFRSKGNGNWAPLKEQTINRKGSSAPLIDKGQLFQSITYEVRSAT